jgi:hypothetical protein
MKTITVNCKPEKAKIRIADMFHGLFEQGVKVSRGQGFK